MPACSPLPCGKSRSAGERIVAATSNSIAGEGPSRLTRRHLSNINYISMQASEPSRGEENWLCGERSASKNFIVHDEPRSAGDRAGVAQAIFICPPMSARRYRRPIRSLLWRGFFDALHPSIAGAARAQLGERTGERLQLRPRLA